MSKMKPLPKFIIVLVAVSAVGYGANFALDKFGHPSQQVSSSQPVQEKPAGTLFQKSEPVPVSDSLQSILDSGTVKASVQSPSKPFFYTDGATQRGFNVEFMKILFSQPAFAKAGNIRIDSSASVDTYEDVPKQLLKSVSGKPLVDIAIDGLTFSNDDLPGVVYSVPYIDDFGYSLITSSSSSIKPGDTLDGLQIGILKGDPDVKAYAKKAFPKATFVELSDESVGNGRDWIDRNIKEGRVDGVIYDYPFAVSEIAGTKLQFAATKLPGSDIRYKIGVRAGDSKLLEAINMSIRKTKEDPEYLNLIRKYFMATNTVKVDKIVSGESTYVVKAGDTLSTIAVAKFGDRMKYRLIETRNNLPNPNLIAVGQKLVIPSL